MNNFDNLSYSEVVDIWWEDWIFKNFISTCNRVLANIFTLIDDPYIYHIGKCLPTIKIFEMED